MRIKKNGIKRLKTVVTYTTNQGLTTDDGVIELVDYLTKNPTIKVIANTKKDNTSVIAYEYSALINGDIVIINNSIGDVFYKSGNTYMVKNEGAFDIFTSPYTKVIWENASPTSSFNSQLINLKISDYLGIAVISKRANNSATTVFSFTPLMSGRCELTTEGNTLFREYSTNANEEKIFFDSGYQYNIVNQTSGLNNNIMIPIYILGVKK